MYLERFGGYERLKTLGLLAWLTAGLLRSPWSENYAAASDRASLLMVCLEQANLDDGSMVAYLKELDTLQSRRAEARRRRRRPPAAAQEEEAQQTGGRYRQRARAKAKAADQ